MSYKYNLAYSFMITNIIKWQINKYGKVEDIRLIIDHEMTKSAGLVRRGKFRRSFVSQKTYVVTAVCLPLTWVGRLQPPFFLSSVLIADKRNWRPWARVQRRKSLTLSNVNLSILKGPRSPFYQRRRLRFQGFLFAPVALTYICDKFPVWGICR